MKFCSDIRVSADTGVKGVRSTSSCGSDLTVTSLASGIASSAGDFKVSLSTLSGSNGCKPHLAHPARMFFFVKALSLAELYREVKCSLPIVFVPARSVGQLGYDRLLSVAKILLRRMAGACGRYEREDNTE